MKQKSTQLMKEVVQPVQSLSYSTPIRLILIPIFLLLFTASAMAQKTWVRNGSGNWSVGSNWSGGTVPTSTDSVVLSANANRTITVDVSPTIKSLTLSGNNFGVTISGTNTLTITGNLTQSAGNLTLGSGTIKVGGNWSRGATGTFNENTGTLEFNGSSAQTISVADNPRNLYKLTINNSSGGVSITSGNLTISNVLTMTSGKLAIGANTLTLNGTVASMSASNCLTGSATSNLTIGGTGALGTLYFDQTTSGTTNNIATLTVNRSTSGTVDIANDVKIGTSLTLTNGIVQTSGAGTEVAIKSGGSVTRTSGHVNGNLQKYVTTGATSLTFEIGDDTYYAPVNISFANVTVAGDLVMSTTRPLSSHPNYSTINMNTTDVINRYWSMSNANTLAFSNYSAVFNFNNPADILGSPPLTSNMQAGLYSSSWTYPTMGTMNTTNTQITGVTSLGSVALTTCDIPTVFSITGGGAYCSGGSGSAVGLSGSQSGVNYQLKLNGTNTGSPVAGTGSAISFGNQTAVGTYTATAIRANSTCTSSMSGSVSVSTNPLPTLYTVTGGGSYCSGAGGMPVGLSGSQSGVNYQLRRNGNNTGSPVAGTGSAISFGNQVTTGTYTVVATNATTLCTATMTGSVGVTALALPNLYSVTGGGSYCIGGSGVSVGLNGSQVGASYQLRIGGVNTGSPVSGTGAAISFGLQTAVGTYTVVATNIANSCTRTMTGSVSVSTNPLPTTFSVTGGGSYCSGGSGVSVGLNGSQSGVSYQLQVDGANTGSPVSGTGSAISFGNQTTAGTYTVIATNNSTSCTNTMTGSVNITIDPLPALYSVTGGGSYCSGGSGIAVGLSGSASGVNYQLKLNGSNTGSPVAGTGSAISFGNQTSAGTYTVSATNLSTSCINTMTGSVTVSIVAVPTLTGISIPSSNCPGTGASVSMTGMVPGSTNTISYNINGVAQTPVSGVMADPSGNAGFTTSILTAANDGQSLEVTAIDNGTCSASFSQSATLSVIQANTWLGINTDWNDAQNWCGSVPAGSANVTIPAGRSNYPLINSGSVQTNNLTIASGASVTVSGATLQVSGNISSSSALDATAGMIELNGSAAQSVAGSMFSSKTIQNLVLSNSNGIQLTGTNDTLKVTGTVSFGASNVVLTTNGNLTLVSNASGTARVDDLTAGGVYTGNDISGNVTVEKYFTNNPKAWHMLAVPTSGATIKNSWMENNIPMGNATPGYGTIITGNVAGAVSLGFDLFTSASASIRTYNSVSNAWDNVNSVTSVMDNPKGYMLFIRGDRSVTTSSQPATTTILRTTGQLYTTGGRAPVSSTVASGKMESIGNPYASAVDFTLLTKTGSVDNKFYVWDPLLTNNSNGLGGYQTLSATNGWKPIPGGTANYNSSLSYTGIQPGQVFFASSTSGGGTVGFTEAAKISDASGVARMSNRMGNRQFLRLSLVNAGNYVVDGNVVAFDQDLSDSLDADDAQKLFNIGENIAIKHNNRTFVLEARHTLMTEDSIHYAISNMRQQNYRLKITPENMGVNGMTAFLIDRFLNTNTPLNLSDTTSYAFSVTASQAGSYAPNRFSIVLKPSTVLPVTFTSVRAARADSKKVNVTWQVEQEMDMDHYELQSGKTGSDFTTIARVIPANNQGGRMSYSQADNMASEGMNFYRVIGVSRNGLKQYSSVASVSAVPKTSEISVYPNPVQNKTIFLHQRQVKTSDYLVKIYDAAGGLVMQSSIRWTAGTETMKVRLPENLSAGIYRLVMNGSTGDSVTIAVRVD